MDITRKTDYALRMLSMLAEGEDSLLSVRTAAERNFIPYSFARSIQHSLVQAGIVESLRGVHGGMRLKADPSQITLREVVEAVQGPFIMNDCCVDGADCPRISFCQFHPVWYGVQSLVADYLSSVTLADVVGGGKHPCVSACYTDPAAFESYVEKARSEHPCADRAACVSAAQE